MAMGKGPRKSSTAYCSTVTLVVFVALCLAGVWMMTSSTLVPAKMSKFVMDFDQDSTDSSNVEEKDNSIDAPYGTNTKSSDTTDRTIDHSVEKTQEQIPETENIETKEESDDSTNTQTFTNSDENNGGGDTNSEVTDTAQKNVEQSEGEKIDEKTEESQDKEAEQKSNGNKSGNQANDEVFPDGSESEILKETKTENGEWSTQAAESKTEKAIQKKSTSSKSKYSWKLCNVEAGADYIPCLDNVEAIKKLHSTKHYEHRERHCPAEGPTCLVPVPDGYQTPIQWPDSRAKIWYHNVPHTKLAVVKGHQNWVKVSGEFLTFPGGGTQFKNGALHYIDKIQEALPAIAWGKQTRVILDVGCGVASFGGFMFERDVLTMSLAPKDEHEAQVQFALERGIPAFSAVMGTKRLPFPGRVYDAIHCARCRVPWHIEGGKLLLELNRMLRPGGHFVWSATPVYQNLPEDVEIWKAMSTLTKAMCWKMVKKTKDTYNQVGMAIFRKPTDNKCYEQRTENDPPLCEDSDDPNAAWNVSLQACMHKIPVDTDVRGSQWPEQWPERVQSTPYWLDSSQTGVYGKPAPEDFKTDYQHWKQVVSKSYLKKMGIDWSIVRNVMDMRSVYGGFAAALRDKKVWVMNVVSVDAPDTLPIIFERGLFGMYHDWCESFSTYPRTYDLLHADHLFSRIKKRCKLMPLIAEVDRILRPEGKLIVRDTAETVAEVENMAKSLHWEVLKSYSKDKEGILCVQKTMWRPQELEAST